VDENQHRYYDISCELARYDTLTFGTEQLRATFINRFNPHDTPELTVPFIDRLKVFIQTIRNQLKCPLSEDEKVAVTVKKRVELLLWNRNFLSIVGGTCS
jgi:hypothetical protein